MRRIESAYPVGVDLPGRKFKGRIMSRGHRYGFVRCSDLPDDLWFSEPRRFVPGDEVQFEIGQRFEDGEMVARNVRRANDSAK